MARLELVIGNRNYSSWSLRPWLALRASGLPFEVVRIPLYREGSAAELQRVSPTGLVPVLREGDLVTWESLAICERVAELAPDAGLWPADPAVRAVARSVATEMHGGFARVREAMPMNFRGRARRTPPLDDATRAQIARIDRVWSNCRARHGAAGPWLFGPFTIADAMYAPVVSRFRTYGIDLSPPAREYADAAFDSPAMREWGEEAAREVERMEETDRLL